MTRKQRFVRRGAAQPLPAGGPGGLEAERDAARAQSIEIFLIGKGFSANA